MLDLLEKELAINGVRILQGGVVEIDGKINLSPREAIFHFKRKAKYFYKVVSKIWNDIIPIVNTVSINAGEPSEGLRDIFVNSLQEMKRLIRIYPFLENHKMIDFAIANALSRDINTFSYRTMSRVIESKLAIDWIGHLVKRNVYICALIGYTYSIKRQSKKVNAAGVGGPFSNLDLPLKERCFEWSEIDEEVRGRSSDLQNQRRYKMGLEGYHDLWPQEGFVWRELKNEPYLWGKEGESPYPGKAGK